MEPAGRTPDFTCAMLERYQLEPDRDGWSVIDVWTGRPVLIAGSAQVGLVLDDASDFASLLNDQARRGNRTVLQ